MARTSGKALGRWAAAGVGAAFAWLGSVPVHAQTPPGETPKTARFWGYLNGTVVFAPNWAFTVMPGIRYEVSRSIGPTKKHYLNELFAGPTFIYKSEPITFRLAGWYYYTGFPDSVNPNGNYYYTHSLELIPIVEYKTGAFTFTTRTIFHNTIYASIYATSKERNGYGLVIRELLQAKYDISKELGFGLADEPFFGVIEDKDASTKPAGYWEHGLRLNRVYVGPEWRATPQITVTPQYVFETRHEDNVGVAEVGHYLFLTVSFVAKTFDAPPLPAAQPAPDSAAPASEQPAPPPDSMPPPSPPSSPQ